LLFAVDAAMAQDQRASFDIPAQPLADALLAYGVATGIEVFYDGALAIGRRSTAVTGVHQSTVALQIQTAALGRYEPYFAVLQARVSEVLCKSDEAKPGDEELILSFWFDLAGMVSHVQVLSSEMSAERRLAIASGVQGLHVGRAVPAGLPQPVTMAIYAPLPGEATGCRPVGRRQAVN
jgi:hypothetical protein